MPGTVEQLLAPVVTLIAELCAEVPAASLAATVNEYGVEGVKPVTAKVGPVGVPIEVPFS